MVYLEADEQTHGYEFCSQVEFSFRYRVPQLSDRDAILIRSNSQSLLYWIAFLISNYSLHNMRIGGVTSALDSSYDVSK